MIIAMTGTNKILILGGVKSGKSRRAEQLAQGLSDAQSLPVIVIATATASDGEMQRRIEAHRKQRPDSWKTIEEPLKLGHALLAIAEPAVVVVDCLTVWLTNLLMQDEVELLTKELESFVQAVSKVRFPLLLVSNETNMGIVPMGELSRRYCDEAGLLHQRLASICDRVELMVAGLPMQLKPSPR